MVQRIVGSPKALIVLLFGTVLGAVWAAGFSATAAPKPGGVSLTPGPGIVMTPNPITSAGTIAVAFGGIGGASTVSHSDHNHDGQYLMLSGGSVNGSLEVTQRARVGASLDLGGNLTLGPGAQLISPRVENAAIAPTANGPGQLWFDTTTQSLQYFDGTQWQAVPTGGAASPILGVSTSSGQHSGTQVFEATSAVVAFTLSAQATVVIEFGGEFEVPSSSARGDLNLYPLVDGIPPQFFAQDAAHYNINSSNNNTLHVTQCSRLVTRVLAAGTHTVVIRASISSDQGATIRYPWLKVTKM
jgi:hypothetical protein